MSRPIHFVTFSSAKKNALKSVCPVCGEVFWPRPDESPTQFSTRRTCSKACGARHRNTATPPDTMTRPTPKTPPAADPPTLKQSEAMTAAERFLNTLENLDDGRFAMRAGIKLQDALEETDQSGKTVELTFKMAFSRPRRGNETRVKAHVTVKLPKEEPDECTMWLDQGVLHNDDPLQRQLDLKDTARDHGDLRVVN